MGNVQTNRIDLLIPAKMFVSFYSYFVALYFELLRFLSTRRFARFV